MRARIFSAILLGLSALLAAAPIGTVQAQDTPAQYAPVQYYGPPPGYGGPGNGVQPLDRLLPGIRRAHPGDFYDAEGPTYGRVIWYDTDARSGRVLRSSPGRDNFDSHQGPPPPGYGRRLAPGGFAPGYSYGPRFAPRYSRPSGGMGGGGRWRH